MDKVWSEKHACTKIWYENVPRYNSLHFPAEMNISDSKTPMTFIPFHANYDYMGRSYYLKTPLLLLFFIVHDL